MSTAAEFSARRAELLDSLRAKPSGLVWCEQHTDLVDEAVRSVFIGLVAKLERVPPFAVVATGGYGRKELAPWSDVDLSFVPLNENDPDLERAIKVLFRDLHDLVADGLGMKLGYALRYPSDSPGLDPKTRSGLLDARVVVGSHEAYGVLEKAFWDSFPVAEFVIDKIEEQAANEQKTNDTPFSTQPELKRGAGGLRSFQSINWIGAAIGERMTPPTPEYDQIVTYRNLLHLVAGKQFDQMTHAKRADVSSLLAMDPFALGSHLAQGLASIHGDYLTGIERLHDARFSLAPNVEAFRGEARVETGATAGQAAIGIANATRLGLRVSDFKADPVPKSSASQALAALSSGEETLRNLDRSGVLDVLLPELTACRTVMPRDASHAFSVFEHTLRVVRNLDTLDRESFLGSIAADLRDRGPLYLAALLHDVGRAEDEATHAELGEQIAMDVCDRWQVYESTKQTVCWLVREHLEFGRLLRMRDVMNPETALELAAIVKTPERLAMLALLTWADVSAVNDQTWTSAQETLLRELFVRTIAVLEAEEPPATDAALYRRRMLELQRGKDVGKEEFEAFLESMPAHYLLSTEPSLAHAHFHLVRAAEEGEISVVLNDVPELGATDVTVCCPDAAGLLSRILGVLYAFDLSIAGIRAATTDDAKPVALDTITASFGGRPIPSSTASRLAKTLGAVLRGEQSVDDIIRAAQKSPDRAQEVLTVNFVAGSPAIIEVQAPRGRGLAYRLARQLSGAGINILGARVGQWAGTGTAAFYVSSEGLDAETVARALEGQKV